MSDNNATAIEKADLSLATLKQIFGESETVPVTFVVTAKDITAKRDGTEFKKDAATVAGQSLEIGTYTAVVSGDEIAFTKVEVKPRKQSCTSMDRL